MALVDGDVYGDGVNVAARLEQLAEPGGVMVSGTACDHLQGKLDWPLDFAGDQQVKNISRPVRMSPATFLSALCALSFEHTFNPYSAQCPVFDKPHAALKRADALEGLLGAALRSGVDLYGSGGISAIAAADGPVWR